MIGGGGGGGANCGGGGGGGGVLQQIINVSPNITVPIQVGAGGAGGSTFTIRRGRRNVKPRLIAGDSGDSGSETVFNGQYSAAGGQGGQGGTARAQAAGGAGGGGGSSGGSGNDKYYESTKGANGVTTGIGIVAAGGTGGFDWDLAPGVNNNNFRTRYPQTVINAILSPVPGGGGQANVNGNKYYGPIANVPRTGIARRTPPGEGSDGINGLGGGGGGGGGGRNNTTVPPRDGGDGGCGACYIYWGKDERGLSF